MKRSGRMRVQLDEGSWGEIRNAVARDNKSVPFDRLSVAVRVGRPVIDAIIALPDDLLNHLYEHHLHGSLEKVLRKALSDIPSPPPWERIEIDTSNKPVVESIGEGIGAQLDPEEGMQRLLAVAEVICLDDRLGRLADAAQVERQLAISVAPCRRGAARAGSLRSRTTGASTCTRLSNLWTQSPSMV